MIGISKGHPQLSYQQHYIIILEEDPKEIGIPINLEETVADKLNNLGYKIYKQNQHGICFSWT